MRSSSLHHSRFNFQQSRAPHASAEAAHAYFRWDPFLIWRKHGSLYSAVIQIVASPPSFFSCQTAIPFILVAFAQMAALNPKWTPFNAPKSRVIIAIILIFDTVELIARTRCYRAKNIWQSADFEYVIPIDSNQISSYSNAGASFARVCYWRCRVESAVITELSLWQT